MKIYQQNQYDNLKSCALCYPVNLKSGCTKEINTDLLYSQYNKLINTLSEDNVKIKFIDIDSKLPMQVFTQDIGFVIEDILFISRMTDKNRKDETEYLKRFAKENNLKIYEMQNNIEGGDVIHYDNIVFVGIGNRTNMEACREIEDVLRKTNNSVGIIPVKFDPSKIHLDTVFNILDKDNAMISPYVYDKDIINKFIKNIFEVTKKDADEFATNYIYLGNKKLISSNKKISKMLEEKGYTVEYIDYSEVIKADGGLECSILYLLRGK
ncbi:MAG: dimethylarginine dimethylaminohydrolase family protein [Clostridium sp.]